MATHQVFDHERELFGYYVQSPYEYPLEGTLTPKNNKLNTKVMDFLVHTFSSAFYVYSHIFEVNK